MVLASSKHAHAEHKRHWQPEHAEHEPHAVVLRSRAVLHAATQAETVFTRVLLSSLCHMHLLSIITS
jgi:hypothetical protein